MCESQGESRIEAGKQMSEGACEMFNCVRGSESLPRGLFWFFQVVAGFCAFCLGCLLVILSSTVFVPILGMVANNVRVSGVLSVFSDWSVVGIW